MSEEEFARHIGQSEQDLKSIHKRLDNLEALTKSVYELATEMKAFRENMSDLSCRISEIEKQPAKHWETVVTSIITAIVGVCIGILFKGGF